LCPQRLPKDWTVGLLSINIAYTRWHLGSAPD
jgi:hypothetical protein